MRTVSDLFDDGHYYKVTLAGRFVIIKYNYHDRY
jgi:hypothetical protein